MELNSSSHSKNHHRRKKQNNSKLNILESIQEHIQSDNCKKEFCSCYNCCKCTKNKNICMHGQCSGCCSCMCYISPPCLMAGSDGKAIQLSPTLNTGPTVITGPTKQISPSLDTGGKVITGPIAYTGPNTYTGSSLDTGTAVDTGPTILAGPGIDTGTNILTGPTIDTSSNIITGPNLEAGPVIDTGANIIAGPTVDTGTTIDAGTNIIASPTVDTGTTIDAGTNIIAGPTVDTGTTVDAGTNIVAGPTVVDTGTTVDAGAAIDADSGSAAVDIDTSVMRASEINVYAYIYNLTGQTIEPEANIRFSNDGAVTEGIIHTPDTDLIIIKTPGIYLISFYVSESKKNVFTLFHNTHPVLLSTLATSPIIKNNIGVGIVSASADDCIAVKNYSNKADIKLEAVLSGTKACSNAAIFIQKIN